MRTFGSFLRQTRKENGITMVELSRKTGISQSYISQLENDISIPSERIIKSLSIGITFSEDEAKEFLCRIENEFHIVGKSFESKDSDIELSDIITLFSPEDVAKLLPDYILINELSNRIKKE